MARPGTVYLVGAGPGDPGLVTARGLRLLREADVVVYDRLVSPRIVSGCRPDAELVYAGKGRDGHTLRQEEIGRLLVEKAREGKSVVRLKGGDPFVFGRGGEEADALLGAGLPFEVVPGVTSAVAVPSYAGIPVTDRRHSSSFSVITGQQGVTGLGLAPGANVQALFGQTLVVLMGVEALPDLVSNLLSQGVPPETPAALIERGTTPGQRTVEATLGGIAQGARYAGVRPPAVLVLGDVVPLRRRFNWFETRPLHGLRVVVTRSADQSGGLVEGLEELGADVVEVPCLSFRPPQDWGPVDRAIGGLPGYTWAAFTSANAVSFFMDRLWALGHDARAMGGLRVAAIGPASAQALHRYGLRADLVPEVSSAQSLAEALRERLGPRDRVLAPRSDIAEDTLARGLEGTGAGLEAVVAYRTTPPDDLRARATEALADGADVVTFASPSAVRSLLGALPTGGGMLSGSAVACIGPRTAREAREAGLTVQIEASEQSVEGMVRAVAAWRASGGGD